MPKSSDLAPLDGVGWLAQQPPAFRDWAAATGRWRRYREGQVLYDAGDPSDGLYGLADGSLDVTFPLVAEEPVTLHRAEVETHRDHHCVRQRLRRIEKLKSKLR